MEAQEKLAEARRGREEDEQEVGERASKLARLDELTKERKHLESELEKLKDLDPTVMADLEKELKLVKEAAHRWTDNIFSVRVVFFRNYIRLFFVTRGFVNKDGLIFVFFLSIY